jgi:hypothetical protein
MDEDFELDLEYWYYLPEESPYDELKRGYFNESRHAKNFKRSTNKNKIVRNIPRCVFGIQIFDLILTLLEATLISYLSRRQKLN